MAKTYNDYPQAATNNAKRALAWREKYGDEVKGGTAVGWTRANQLASREALSYSTIARMAAFARHRTNSKVDPKYAATPWKDRGYVAWLIWGGTSGVNWAIRKAESIRKGTVKLYSEEDEGMVEGIVEIIRSIKDLENRMEVAKTQYANLISEGVDITEEEFMRLVGLAEAMAKQGEDGTIRESRKAPDSDTKNKNPKGVGKGGKLSPEAIKSIENKIAAHNNKYPSKTVSVATAKKVVLRGMGAYNTSHSPMVKSATQWGLARLNAFLYLVVKGKPQNPKYKQDNDLL
jgi:hypothetical protein